MSLDLAVVVPVLDEAENVAPLVSALDAALRGVTWEVLFIDDDSPDGTAAAVSRLADGDARVRLILRVENPGLANACIQGMLSTHAKVLCVMDADAQHDPASIPLMLDAMRRSGADVVSAARDPAVVADAAMTPLRHALSRWGNAIARSVSRRPARDPLSGFFVIRRAAFLEVVRDLSNSGFKLLFDILATGPHLDHIELPHALRPRLRGKSKLDVLVIWQVLTLAVEKLTRGLLPARLSSFLAVGASGVAVHLAVLYACLAAAMPFPHAQLVAATGAASSNYLLNNLLTFRDRRFSGRSLGYGWIAYLAASALGICANVGVAGWLYDRQQRALAAALAGICVDVAWKYMFADRVIWRKRRARNAIALTAAAARDL